MALTLAHYETLFWISRLGTFRAAANLLSVSQPTVSMRVRELERELGTQLFAKAGRHVSLTEDGRTAADYADRILALSQDLTSRIRRHGTLHGTLRFGIPDALAIAYLPKILLALERKHPTLRISASVESSDVLSHRLGSGVIDAAIIVGRVSDNSVRQTEIGISRCDWVASPRLLRPGRCYGAEDLARHRIFTNRAPSIMHALITSWFEAAGESPSDVCNCNSVATILALAQGGACIALLPRELITDAIANGHLFALEVSHPVPEKTIFLSVPRISTNPASPILKEIAQEVLGASDALLPEAEMA